MFSYRVVRLDDKGKLCQQDFPDRQALCAAYEQTGVEEDSYSLRLHGEPTFKSLVGPMSDGKNVIRYETPEVFVQLTEKWSKEMGRFLRRGNP